MRLIAHRGLINGPDQILENNPKQIEKVLKMGFDAEIDLWINEGSLFLGHDKPQYQIQRNFLNSDNLWIHAKNHEALIWLTTSDLNYFWHQNDDYVITSHCYVWAYPGKLTSPRSICVMPEWHDPDFKNIPLNCFGICSDYINKIFKKIQ